MFPEFLAAEPPRRRGGAAAGPQRLEDRHRQHHVANRLKTQQNDGSFHALDFLADAFVGVMQQLEDLRRQRLIVGQQRNHVLGRSLFAARQFQNADGHGRQRRQFLQLLEDEIDALGGSGRA